VLDTKEDMVKAEDLGDYYRIPADNRDLNYDRYISKGSSRLEEAEEYNSHNTARLDVEGMKELLKKLEMFQ
jgi:UDP-glucose 4-epimerase